MRKTITYQQVRCECGMIIPAERRRVKPGAGTVNRTGCVRCDALAGVEVPHMAGVPDPGRVCDGLRGEINAACDAFLRSRGLPVSTPWGRLQFSYVTD